MSESPKDARRRAAQAWTDKLPYNRQLIEIYRYVMPFRDVSGLGSGQAVGNVTPGANRTDFIFDGTAVNAAFTFAGAMQNDLTPFFQPFFELSVGPLGPTDPDERKRLTEAYQQIGHMVHAVLSTGTFHMRSGEMYTDLYAGTGAMLVMPDKIGSDICHFQCVPIPEIALIDGPYGDVWGVDWKKRYRAVDLKLMWPNGKFTDTMKQRFETPGDGEASKVTIHQYTMFDPETRKWVLSVWAEEDPDGHVIHTEEFRCSPWITPRFFRVPGEVYGRGPAHLALPYIKTTNKVRELALLAAAFAVMGLWIQRNDGLFNPDTARLEPGAIWKVSSTGGPLGASIARLDTPKNFDITHFVIEDEREQMKRALFDDTLPPDTGPVRSATEIAERMKKFNQNRGGIAGRLTLEIVKPLVQRVIDILETTGKLPTNIKIDQLQTMVRVIAPIAAGQQAERFQKAVNWVQSVGMLAGPQAALLAANVEDLFPEMGRWLGVDERFIRSKSDIAKMQKMMAVAQARQEQQANAPPAEQPDPAQQIAANGAM